MSKSLKCWAALGLALALALPAAAETASQKRSYNIGRIATPAEIAGWDIDVRPDGQGLPDGRGTVEQGEPIYMAKCAACHGEFGEGAGRWPMIAGGKGSLRTDSPSKTVGSYFAQPSTLFSYVRHAMPFGEPQSLTSDELYSLVAYVLFLSDIVDEKFEMSRDSFKSVKMPNADGFFDDDRDRAERAFWTARPCMSNCKSDVTITSRARALDVTPQDRKPAAD